MHVNLVEVGPRDGLQNEATLFSTDAKVEFVSRIVASGIRRIEVASFVNPRRVPQMADAEAVLQALPQVEGVRYIGLVLNRRGFDRALAVGCAEVGMVVAASDSFGQRNQARSSGESIAAWREIAAAARAAGIHAQVTISVAFGCPYEGEVASTKVVDIAREIADAQPFELAIADTIGVAVPTQVSELIQRVRAALPGMPLRAHFHNTRNTGLANAWAAVQAGASVLDSSAGGIGGCPFAPAATGNIPTEDLLYLLARSGVETGADLGRCIETAAWLQQQLGRPVPGLLSRAPPFPATASASTPHPPRDPPSSA
ncbi:MAG: hydroxymethylglutaryl-CoA lyase [Gammaproteobacteria bacterium]|nr:hydroxymethylglutaryl-CoA lyase [Gammaproteobacteria bacterium]